MSYLLPSLPASAGALVFDRFGRLLVLKPTYKSGWTIPGGVMEDDETPWQACRREVLEECGIHVDSGRLACVDTRPAKPGRPLSLRFLFDCGRLPELNLGDVVLQREEISEARLAKPGDALGLLRPAVQRRAQVALTSRACRYLEDGRPVDGVA
jgi:ADP-ribose pyrophosphatase YjhB (NUDIX family)